METKSDSVIPLNEQLNVWFTKLYNGQSIENEYA